MRTWTKRYTVYIVTNLIKTVLYIGITNDLQRRILEHYDNRGTTKSFAGKYNCHFVVYYEEHQYVNNAIAREKELKGWLRKKKNQLISDFNPEWKFLNEELFGEWPPQL